MSRISRLHRAAAASAHLAAVGLLWQGAAGALRADEPPPATIDSQTIVRSLRPGAAVSTRGFEVAPKNSAGTEAVGGGSGGAGKITLDIRFASDSDRLTAVAQRQLAALGAALNSPELTGQRFLIAGHTSATGAAPHNQRLSEARARAVRSYLIERFKLAPDRLEATGYGSSRPLPDFAPDALQQRRVEIITLASHS